MSWDGRERRKRKRYGVKDASIQYKPSALLSFISPSSPKYLVLNLSEGGVEFMTRDKMEEGRKLSMTLQTPNSRGGIRARAKVVWVKKSGSQEAYRVGARVTGLSDRARSLLKAVLDSAVIDSVEISTRVYLKEIEKL